MIRGQVKEYKCRCCEKPFSARVADRDRGWAQYCSKKCKQITQEEGKRVWNILSTVNERIQKWWH